MRLTGWFSFMEADRVEHRGRDGAAGLRAELAGAGERSEVRLALDVRLAGHRVADVDREGSDAHQHDGQDRGQDRVGAALVTLRRVPISVPRQVSFAVVDCVSTSMRATYSRVSRCWASGRS